jgi:lysophospholipase L1-like esterase
MVVSSTPTTTDRVDVVLPPTSGSVIALGDSQTEGLWLDQPTVDSWPAQLDRMLCPESSCITNLARGGQSLVTDVPGGPPPLLVSLDEQLSGRSDARIAVVLIGQVDLVSSDDIGSISAAYGELLDRLLNAGVESVLFVTLFPFDPTTYPNPAWLDTLDQRRHALIDSLRALSAEDGARVVDVESLLTLEDTGWLRPSFGVHDGNHPSTTGGRVIAEAVAEEIRR